MCVCIERETWRKRSSAFSLSDVMMYETHRLARTIADT